MAAGWVAFSNRPSLLRLSEQSLSATPMLGSSGSAGPCYLGSIDAVRLSCEGVAAGFSHRGRNSDWSGPPPLSLCSCESQITPGSLTWNDGVIALLGAVDLAEFRAVLTRR